MVLKYCKKGDLRNYLNISENYIDYGSKVNKLQQIARGLLDVHNAGHVHKDFHSGNILFNKNDDPYISDLGMCQPANKKQLVKGIYGVIPYMAPEVLRGHQYTKSADIYSFGIIMNEFLSEEIPFNNILYDEFLVIKICKGFRPKISKDVPKLLANLIIKCWDAKMENRPTTKELYHILKKWNEEIIYDENSEIYFQIKKCDIIGRKKFENRKNRQSKDKSKNIQTYSQAIYTSRALNFKNLPKPVNSSDLSSLQFNSDANCDIQPTNPISECLDVQLNESELNEIYQDEENNIE
ncbi:kinase-like domain-containing protein [Rhizophagus diaphanus]|nr:kinase-like domain-containing protein [Rhizophagus diaphanus] [Rhizophagus sp. MUCL 43196]